MRAVIRSAAATSIDARSAIVRGLRSIRSRRTSSIVTSAGSAAVCADATPATRTNARTLIATRRTLLILHLERRDAPHDKAVDGWQHEERDRDRGHEAADDHDRKRLLRFAADAAGDRHRREAEDGEHRRHQYRAEPARGTVRKRRNHRLATTAPVVNGADDQQRGQADLAEQRDESDRGAHG